MGFGVWGLELVSEKAWQGRLRPVARLEFRVLGSRDTIGVRAPAHPRQEVPKHSEQLPSSIRQAWVGG